jgi:hypothetical protein
MDDSCGGCAFLRYEKRPQGMVAARCANPAPTGCAIRGFGRTLEVFRTGEPGPVMRPVWCRGERKALSGAARQLPQRGSQDKQKKPGKPEKETEAKT